MPADVVVEIGPHRQAMLRPLPDAIGPRAQALGRVPTSVPLARAMKSDIDEWTDRPRIRRRSLHVVQAERHTGLLQEATRLGPVPCGVPELEGLRLVRECVKEDSEPLVVRIPSRRQLVQNRAEPVTQVPRSSPEPLERLLRIAQPPNVGQVSARLDGEPEARRHAPSPTLEHCCLWQPIERVVELDSVEIGDVALQPSVLRKAGRVEAPGPMPV